MFWALLLIISVSFIYGMDSSMDSLVLALVLLGVYMLIVQQRRRCGYVVDDSNAMVEFLYYYYYTLCNNNNCCHSTTAIDHAPTVVGGAAYI